MKRKITALFLSAVMAAASASSAFADVSSIRVDNAAVEFGDTEPIIVDGYTYVPIRSVFEQMGTVDWDAETKAVIITTGEAVLKLYTSTGEIYVNDVKIEPSGDEPTLPIIQDGTTLLPVRAIAEALGANVNWNSDDSTIDIYSYGYSTEKLEETLSGVPLPLAILKEFTDDSFNGLPNIYFEDLLDMTDNEGYDGLVSAIRDCEEISEEIIALGDDYDDARIEEIEEKFTETFSRFSYYLVMGLDGLEDKSDLTGIMKVLQNTDVTVDDSVSNEDSLAALEELVQSDEAISITVNKKLSPLAKASADTGSYDEEYDSLYSEEHEMFKAFLLAGYTYYLSTYEPEISAAADTYEDLFDMAEGFEYVSQYILGIGDDSDY